MGVTRVDLYRNGNAAGPRLHHVRTQIAVPDVDIIIDAIGDFWVLAASGKGVSSWEAPVPSWSKPWRLSAGSTYPNSLRVWPDGVSGHWAWAPAHTMLLSDYIAALVAVTPLFKSV
jgi:hypothetical protein